MDKDEEMDTTQHLFMIDKDSGGSGKGRGEERQEEEDDDEDENNDSGHDEDPNCPVEEEDGEVSAAKKATLVTCGQAENGKRNGNHHSGSEESSEEEEEEEDMEEDERDQMTARTVKCLPGSSASHVQTLAS